MGLDDQSVLAPTTMLVHGLDGIRVVDASSMPYVTNGNIYAPVVMLAKQADVEKLAGIVPLVDRVGQVDALVALEADEARAQDVGHHLGCLGLADACLALDEQWLLELEGPEDRRCQRQVVDGATLAPARPVAAVLRDSAPCAAANGRAPPPRAPWQRSKR